MQIYGASAPIGWLAGRQLANIFPEDVTDGFQKLWNDILAVEERGELDRTVLSFSNIEMRFSPKKMALISGTVEVTRTASGDLDVFLCFRMPVPKPRKSPRRSIRSSTTAATSLGTFPLRLSLSPMSSESVCSL